MTTIGILASHPIQYQAPIFRELAKHAELVVLFAYRQTPAGQAAAGFNTAFEWDVDLLSGYNSRFLDNVANRPGLDHFRGCDTPSIGEVIRAEKFDGFVVMGWQLLCYWQAVMACRKHAVPILVRGDSQLLTYRSWTKTIFKAIAYPWLLKLFDGFLYVGARNRSYLKRYKAVEEKLFFSPHCVDNDFFGSRASLQSRADMRRVHGIDPHLQVVLFVGRLLPFKRPQDVLIAVQKLRQGGSEVVCVFAGDGELRTMLEQLAKTCSVPTVFLGFKNQSELPAVYSMADVMALPSESAETWGLVVNEALASGTPVVTSDAVGCEQDLVVFGKTGASYPVGDTTALAAALAHVLGGGADRSFMQQHIGYYSVEAAALGMLTATRAIATFKSARKK